MLKQFMVSTGVLMLIAGFTAALLGTTSHQAVAAPEVSSGAITLPMLNDTQLVYEETSIVPPPMVAVTIKVSSGIAAVENWNGTAWTPIGILDANQGTTFEGEYSKIRVKANLAATVGTYSNRRPTDTADSTHLIGEGSVSLSTSPIRIFTRSDVHHRNILIENTGGSDISIRKTSSGADILVIEAGDAAFLSDSTANYWLSGAGTASYTIYDEFAAIGASVKPGTCSGNADKVKQIFAGDGSTCFKVTITNTGSAAVTVQSKYKASAEAESDIELSANDSIDVTCKLEYVKIKFPHSATGTVSFTSTAQTNPE